MSDSGLIAQDAIYGGLDALLSILDIDLAAYLHVPSSSGPQLFLRRPELAALDASQAFALFSALRDALDRGSTAIPGYHAVLVATEGPASRGLHAIGRRDAKLTDAEHATAGALCRATASVAHALEPVETRLEPRRVAIEIAAGVVSAEVEVLRPEGPSVGKAEGRTAQDAVAAAALAAFGGGAVLADAREVAVADDRAAVVLVEGAGARRIGSALCVPGADPLFAFAVAAVEAASRLPT